MSPADTLASPRAAHLFAALGDETRLRLLVRISSDGPASMAQLGSKSRITRQAIAKHVQVLADAGLVKTTRRGRERVCELDPRRIADAQQVLKRIAGQWDDALLRLKAHVER